MARDPVCNMIVEDTPYFVDVENKRYFFCSQGCLEAFQHSREKYLSNYVFDLIIVGGGPAALTAGVYASIFRLDTLLIAQSLGGQAVDSTKIKNYMGFDFITGPELKEKFQNQLLHKNYIAHQIATVNKVTRSNSYLSVYLDNGKIYRARALIIATGMSRNHLNVPGEEKFQRRGVCYSVVQDAPLFAGQDVVVAGGGNSATQAVTELSTTCRKVYVVSLTPLTADTEEILKIMQLPKVEIFEKHQIEEIGGTDRVEFVRIKSIDHQTVRQLDVSGIFVEIGFYPNSGLVAGLVELNERGEIKIGPDCSTTHPGIFAAGDVTDAFGKRIIIASGEGAKAAIAVRKYLNQLKMKEKNGASISDSPAPENREK